MCEKRSREIELSKIFHILGNHIWRLSIVIINLFCLEKVLEVHYPNLLDSLKIPVYLLIIVTLYLAIMEILEA